MESKLNKELFLEVKKHIQEKPRRFVMRAFFLSQSLTGKPSYFNDASTRTEFEDCGTAACIGGWAVILHDGSANIRDIRMRAIKVLGLENHLGDPYYLRDDVFTVDGWPPQFRDTYQKARSAKQRAKVAGQFIDWFIENGK